MNLNIRGDFFGTCCAEQLSRFVPQEVWDDSILLRRAFHIEVAYG